MAEKSQLISILVSTEEPEEPRQPANTEAAIQLEMCEFLSSRGVKRALIDNNQYYFEENINNG